MFQNILIAEDDPACAKTIQAVAYALGERFHANLILLHVAADHVSTSESIRRYERLRQQEIMLEHYGISATGMIEFGDTNEMILQVAKRLACDLLVTMPHPHSTALAFWRPSITTQLLSKITIPMLIWPEQANGADTSSSVGTSIPSMTGTPALFAQPAGPVIVPLDGSDVAARAIPVACSWGRTLGRPLLLLRVVPHLARPGGGSQVQVWSQPVEQSEVIRAKEALDALRQELMAASENAAIPAINIQVKVGVASEHILHLAANTPDGMIVMSTHGRGLLPRLVLGSVANMVIHHATIPTIVVPARASTRGEEALADQQEKDTRLPVHSGTAR